MPTPEEIAARAAELVSEATTNLIELAGPGGAEALKAASMLGGPMAAHEVGTRASWERHAVVQLVLAAKTALDDDNHVEESVEARLGRSYFEAREALRHGDVERARKTLEQLRAAAEVTPPDHWNHGNVIHHLHVVSGLLHLEDGAVDAAAKDLRAAGQVRATPQLLSFGPDLTLAWALLARGRDDDVVAYLRAVSAFWSPRRFG